MIIVTKVFQCRRNKEAGVFKFLKFGEHFYRLSFRDGLISEDGRPSRRNKPYTFNFAGVDTEFAKQSLSKVKVHTPTWYRTIVKTEKLNIFHAFQHKLLFSHRASWVQDNQTELKPTKANIDKMD